MNKWLLLGVCLLGLLMISSSSAKTPHVYIIDEIPEQTPEVKALIQEFLQTERGMTYRQELLELCFKDKDCFSVVIKE